MSRISGIWIERPPVDRIVNFSSWIFGRPFSLVLGVMAAGQLAAWLPHYLTWPYWADHDVFANAARAWDQGDQPYRDVLLNNFPGTIYLFYLLGKMFGWGRPSTFYAFDGALVLTLVGLLVAWSRKRFERALPGLVGALAFLGFYLSLDYSRTAQRDFQAPCLVILAILVAQAWPGRAGWMTSAVLAAFGFSIRPQVVLFLPALLLATSRFGEPDGASLRAIRRGAAWLVAFGMCVAILFLPLAANGIFLEFVRSLRHVSFGSSYNRFALENFATLWLVQSSMVKWLVVPALIYFLSDRTPNAWVSRSWLLAMAGATFYKPLSPVPHSYLDIPLALIWSVVAATLAGLFVSRVAIPDPIRLLGVLTLLCLAVPTFVPESCSFNACLRVVGTLRSGIEPETPPVGYRHGVVPTAAYYPWQEYRATLLYLREHTEPSTRVANALKGDPAVVSEIDRPSVFPAEAITWLKMVERDDEPAFAESLDRAGDSVVLWTPGSFPLETRFHIPRIESAIRRNYRFESKFGMIEVWRHREDLVKR